jgi:tetratricopeptide (TPR) repeat protein
VLIARNEAAALPRLLGSLAGFLDRGGEVLLVDTGSDDATRAVARAGGCRVEAAGERFAAALGEADAARIEVRFARGGEGPLVRPGERLFHFAAARQHAGLRARRDHVFQVDAADELVAFDVDRVDAAVRAGAARVEYWQDYAGVTLRIARLYDRRRFAWRGRVHEALYASPPGATGGPVARLPRSRLLVRHHRDPGKPRPYLAGLALEALERPGDPRWLHYLGRELHGRGHHRSALAALDAHARRRDAWTAERSESLCLAGRALEALGQPAAAVRRYRRAAALDPARREPWLRLAELYRRRADFAGSAACAERALGLRRTSPFAEAEANYTWQPHALLYWSLFWLGRRADARRHWRICRRLLPGDAQVAAHAALFVATGSRRGWSGSGGAPAAAGRGP